MSSPMERLPRLHTSQRYVTPPVPGGMFHDAIPRMGSPNSGCSILITSAPQSLRTAAAAGTKAYMATSTPLTPSSTFTSASPGHGSMVGGQFDEHFGELLF